MAGKAIIMSSFLCFMRCIYMLMTMTSTGISLEMKKFLQRGSEVQPGWQCARDTKVISKKEEMFYGQFYDELWISVAFMDVSSDSRWDFVSML